MVKLNSTRYFGFIRILSAVTISMLFIFAIIWFVSDTPLLAMQKMILGPFETKRSFFNIIEQAIPLIFSALALNVILRSGIFSIAADGSFYMGGIAATAVACKIQAPTIVHQTLLMVAAAIVGGVISTIPIWLGRITKADITVLSIMFNSIFFFFGYSLISTYLSGGSGAWGSAYFPDTAMLGNMLSGTSLHWGFVIMLVVLVLVILIMEHSAFGYKIRLTGSNILCAKSAGIRTERVILGGAFFSGAIAGIGGAVEVVGMYKRFLWSVPVTYVWDGLMIHMMANEKPALIPVAALFIAYLRVGADVMSRSTDVSNEIVSFFQGVIILLVVSKRFLSAWKEKKEQALILQQAQQGGQ